jgi:hypothetical protein
MHVFDDLDDPGWHQLPEGDAWKRCTLRGVADDGKRLWIECYACGRFEYLPVIEWSENHGVDLDTPLLLINPRIRCRRCNRRQVKISAEPYSNHPKPDEAELRAAREREGLKCPLCGSANVSQSAPLRVPFDWLRPSDRFMPYTIKIECDCHNCGNWLTQPQ